jgi:hypothetical protein
MQKEIQRFPITNILKNRNKKSNHKKNTKSNVYIYLIAYTSVEEEEQQNTNWHDS